MKKLNAAILLTLLAISFSCKQNAKNTGTAKSVEVIEYVTVEAILQNAEKISGDTVYVSGIVDHVCKHGNKRFKILSTNGKQDMKIELGESFEIPNPDIAGKTAKVIGILVPFNMDADMLQSMINKEKIEHHEEGEVAHLNKLEGILKQIETGEIPYHTTYSVQAVEYGLE